MVFSVSPSEKALPQLSLHRVVGVPPIVSRSAPNCGPAVCLIQRFAGRSAAGRSHVHIHHLELLDLAVAHVSGLSQEPLGSSFCMVKFQDSMYRHVIYRRGNREALG